MKILHYTEQFYAPSETFIIDIVKSTQANNTIEVCTHNKLVDSIDFKIHDISLRKNTWVYKKIIGFINKVKGRGPNTHFNKAQKVIKTFSPDIVHCHFGTSAFYFNSIQDLACLDIPQVISLHGFDVFTRNELFPGDAYMKCFTRLAQKNNVIFTTPSQFLKNETVAKMGIPPEKIQVVYNGFNSDLFKPKVKRYFKGDKLLISNVSRFVHWKGQKYIIEALALLKAQGFTNIQVDFIGYGEKLSECQTLSKSLNVAHMCTFHGGVDHKKVSEIVSNSHLYVHSAITGDNGQTETFGVAILEAITMAKPVIFFNSGGIPEVFGSKESKYYVGIDEKNVKALTNMIIKMKDVIQDLDEDDLLKSSKEVSEQFNNEKCTLEIINIYNDLQRK